MSRQALFGGLVVDENDRPVEVVTIGSEPCYVVEDDGFRRHIPSEEVDRQVLQAIAESIQGHEDLLREQTAKMLGAEDPFSVAIIENQLRNIDKQFDQVMEVGIPVETPRISRDGWLLRCGSTCMAKCLRSNSLV